ncbi:MAG: InlB B-repeat-containing protein, partial [Candidatus Coproplasma sp.]
FNTVLTAETTIYAKWTAKASEPTPATEYTVHFNLNGHGTAIADAQTVDGKVAKPTDPTDENYDFGGWYTDAACTAAFDFNTVLTAETTIYAKWTAKQNQSETPTVTEHTITFNLNGKGADTTAQTVDGKAVEPTEPTAEGFIFDGWYEDAECTQKFDFAIAVSSNKTLYAKWTEEQTDEGAENYGKITYVYAGDESAALEWTDSSASQATVQYKLSTESTYTTLDYQLIRQKDGATARADIIGLKGGASYDFKVTDGSGGVSKVSSVAITAYDRSGYAHFNYTEGVGAYNDDGTLKSDAIVVYVSEETKNTVTATLGSGTYTGIVNILSNASKSTKPLVVRVIGTVGAATWNKIDYNADKQYNGNNLMPASVVVGINGKQLPTDKNTYQADLIAGGYNTLDTSVYSELIGLDSRAKYSDGEYDTIWNNCPIKNAKNVTLEGVGEDARIFQWGITWSDCNSIEVRNLTFEDYPEDACSFEGSSGSTTMSGFKSKNLWLHHNTFEEGINYWDLTAEQDKHEGDGATDFKQLAYLTTSYNVHHNNHKTGLVGGSDSVTTACVTFHHNYYNNNSSRLPLARQANMHMYNNYYYNSTGTNMSIRAGAYAFIENCYFENANNPIEIKSYTYVDDDEVSHTLWGAAKVYGCTFTGKTPASNSYLYITTDRTLKVNNDNIFSQDFDTDPGVFYYDSVNKCTKVTNMLTAEQVKTQVPMLAGVQKRVNYISSGDSGAETPGGDESVTGTSVVIFSDGAKCLVDGELTTSLYGCTIVATDVPKMKEFSYNGTAYSNSVKLNSTGSVIFTPAKDCTATVCYYDYLDKTDTTIKIGDEVYGGTAETLHSDEYGYYHLVEVQFKAGVSYTIVRGTNSEISLCYMILNFG